MKKYPVVLKIAVIICLFGMPVLALAGEAEVKQKKAYQFSLEEITEMALLNNFDIQLTKYDAWIARTDKNVARSIYDTIFETEVKYHNDQSSKATTGAGTKVIDNDYNVGVSKKLPTGTTISVDMTNNRQSTDSALALSPLTHDSTLGVTIEQDLGKNFLGISDRGDMKVTLINIENAEYTSLEKIEESIAEVQNAYWDLVLEIELTKIQEEMVAEAKKLYDLHQEKLEDGLVELPEAIASEANYKSRKNTLLLVQNRVQTKTNVLKLLLNIEGDVDIEPTEEFDLLASNKEGLLEALKKAFENRQDYKKARNEIKSKDIELTLKRNNMWPEINLTATLEKNGLGDHFKQAVTQISQEDNPDFFAGLKITFPLENRAAKGQLKAAELEKAKALLELKLLERQIAVDITDQVRDCNVFKE
ncbi:MAG: TolC family protein, partial [Candidatus Omnitrophica bacterium]|nr:TolC family protein [Candidatus Omnitrophota bacterium]